MPATRRTFLRSAAGVAGVGGLLAGRVPAAPPEPKKILILGGTGFLGPQVVEAAQARGHTLTLFNRGRTRPELFPGVEKLRGDRDGDLKALEGRKWDAVVDTSGYVPRTVKDSAKLLAPNVGHYLFVSSVSVYADLSSPGADETAKVAPLEEPNSEDVRKHYGPLKALCEQAAEAEMPGRVAVIRPGLIVGPGDPSDRFTYWPVRVARGGDVLAPGAPDDPVQLIDVRDLGAWIVRLIEDKTTGVFNALGPVKPLTMGRMLDACKQASGSDARFVWADAEFLAKQKVRPWSDMPAWLPSSGETAGFARVSHARATRAGLTFRPIVETARDTLKWFRTLPEARQKVLRAGIKPEREAKVLAAWNEAQAKK